MAKKAKKEILLTPEEKLVHALVPEADQPYRVPDNWCWTTLGGITQVIGGGTPSSGNPDYYECGNIPWISPADLSNYSDMYISNGAKNITELGLEKSSARMLPKNTVCLSSRAPIGYVVIAANPLSTNQGFKSFLPSPSYIPQYLYWYLKGNKELLESRASGTTFLELSGSKAATIEFPLAPLAEQQRIVDRIESLFAKLDEAKEKAQAVVDGFENRKAAILHKAFTGQMTTEWRNKMGMTAQPWEQFTYGELGISKLGKMLDKEKNIGRPVPYLRNINVRWFGFDLSDISTMLASDEEIETLQVRDGDLFICEGGEPGRCAIWNGGNSELIFQKALHRFRPNEKVKSEYLCYYLFFLSLSGSLQKHFTGTTIKHLTGKSLAEIQIMLPTITEQEQIVLILNELFSLEQQAKEAAEQVLEQVDVMKKSILARAFRGELGTNDPTDESAEELLKRIL